MGSQALVVDRETPFGVQQALGVLASFRRSPVYPVVGKRALSIADLSGAVYVRKPGAIVHGTDCACGRADCAAIELGDIWGALDETALGEAGDIQAWLALRAYQITRDACHNGERLDFDAGCPDLTACAEVVS